MINDLNYDDLDEKDKKLIDLVRNKIKLNKKIKAVSGKHSKKYYSKFYDDDIDFDDDFEYDENDDYYKNEECYFINMMDYKIKPKLENDILCVSPGTELNEINKYLKNFGLKLNGVPESGNITIGGAVLMGAHNGSKLYDVLAKYVKEMWIINGLGEIKILREGDKDYFINYGTLGITFRIKIKCYRATNVEWNYKYFLNNSDMKELIMNYDNTHSIIYGAYSGISQMAFIKETNKPNYYSISKILWILVRRMIQIKLVTMLVEFLLKYVNIMGMILSEFNLWNPNYIRNKYDNYEMIPDLSLYSMEYGVDIIYWEECYEEIKNMLNKNAKLGYFITYRFWSRIMKKGEMKGSLNYGKDVVLFEIVVSKNQYGNKETIKNFENILLKYGGKPHLGKTFIDEKSLKNYDFTYLINKMKIFDPNKLFLNKFQEKVFYNN